MPEHGPHAVTVPGAVSGWKALHEQGANLKWSDAFTHAVAYAHGGVSVASSLAEELDEEQAHLATDPGLSSIFFVDGVPMREFDLVRQPELGATLQIDRRRGARRPVRR